MLNLMVNIMVVLGFIFPQPVTPESTAVGEEDRTQLLDKETTSEVIADIEEESLEEKIEIPMTDSIEISDNDQAQKESALKQLGVALMAIQQEANSEEVENSIIAVNGEENEAQKDEVSNTDIETENIEVADSDIDEVTSETDEVEEVEETDSSTEDATREEDNQENAPKSENDDVNQEDLTDSTESSVSASTEESVTESQDQTVAKEQSNTTEDGVSETESVFRNYRQTFYSVTAGEVRVGYGLSYLDDGVKVIDNVMHYYDSEYEWLPIVAVNIDEVMEVGLNERGIPSYYGTVLEITYPTGDTQKAIVLDACGACSWDNRIDLWVYDHDYQHDVIGIEYRIVREGFKQDEE